MSTRHSRRRSSIVSEEPAGWLYADMLLALVVVGLSAVWVQSKSGDETAAASTAAIATTTTSTAPPTTSTSVDAAETTEPATTSPPTTQPTTPPFQLSCQEFFVGPDLLADDDQVDANVTAVVNWEIASRGWTPETARPGLVIVFGGYDRGSEGPAEGEQRARAEAAVIRARVPLLAAVEMRTSGSTGPAVNGTPQQIGGAGRFGLVVYLVYQGAPLIEDCTS